MLYVTTESPKFSSMYQYASFMCLRQAFAIISDTDAANNCTIMLRTLIESTDLKKMLEGE